jgi:hypothetical protein
MTGMYVGMHEPGGIFFWLAFVDLKRSLYNSDLGKCRRINNMSRAKGKKPRTSFFLRGGGAKKLQKAATKAPNPILHEIRGSTYTHNHKAVFTAIENPFFRLFVCPLGGFLSVGRPFCCFSCGASSRQKPGLFPRGLVFGRGIFLLLH